MPKVEIIDCKTKNPTLTYLFIFAMVSKSTIAGNISAFKELNINQFGLEKDTQRFDKLLTI